MRTFGSFIILIALVLSGCFEGVGDPGGPETGSGGSSASMVASSSANASTGQGGTDAGDAGQGAADADDAGPCVYEPPAHGALCVTVEQCPCPPPGSRRICDVDLGCIWATPLHPDGGT